MLEQAWLRTALLASSLAALVLLAGCVSANGHSGAGMMQGGSQYHAARPTCWAPNSLPGRTVQVTVGDVGMTQTMSGTAAITAVMRLQATPAGQTSFVVTNSGWRTHEMVILSLAPGAAAGQRTPGSDGKVSETGILGEASSSCAAGPGTGITSGSVGWVPATLAPGRYELLCNLANHYADGMRQAIVIS
jgi:uncharacterized cupredoxin-like copper-binding protein